MEPCGGAPAKAAEAPEEDYRVTTLELFFDLVFVFTITQLTGVLAHELSPVGLLRVVALFGVLWWIYSGYAWLTNTVAPTTTLRRLLLLGPRPHRRRRRPVGWPANRRSWVGLLF